MEANKLLTVEQSAQYLSKKLDRKISPRVLRHHTYANKAKLLEHVVVRSGKTGPGHRATKIYFTPAGLDWFAQILPILTTTPGPRPESFVDDLLNLYPPPEIENPFPQE